VEKGVQDMPKIRVQQEEETKESRLLLLMGGSSPCTYEKIRLMYKQPAKHPYHSSQLLSIILDRCDFCFNRSPTKCDLMCIRSSMIFMQAVCPPDVISSDTNPSLVRQGRFMVITGRSHT